MIVIVGGGPSAASGSLGPLIDRQFVVRMKHAKRDPEHRGMRMDAYFSRGYAAKRQGCDFWYFPKRPPHPEGCDSTKWLAFYAQFSRGKPSTGLCALFCAAQFYPGVEVGLIGYDTVLDRTAFRTGPHDSGGEYACAHALNLKLFDLRTEAGQTRLREALLTRKENLHAFQVSKPSASDGRRRAQSEVRETGWRPAISRA